MNSEKDPDIFCLNKNFSTTRYLSGTKPRIINRPEKRFKSVLFLPGYKTRKEEGGLRTKGYFKRNLPEKPLVTVITVVFNGEQYLETTIRSVINQTYDNLEYIIIDGASTDGTLDLIRVCEDKIDYWISEKDEGIYHAMNKGIAAATGEIIGIVNSDDWLVPDAVEKVADTATTIPAEEFVVHGKIAVFDADDNYVEERSPKKIPGYHLFSTPFKHPAMFTSRKLYCKLGLYDNYCGLAADYDMMLRIIREDSKAVFVDKVLTNVRLVGVSTGGYAKATNKELMLIIKRNTGSWFMAVFALFGRSIYKLIMNFKF